MNSEPKTRTLIALIIAGTLPRFVFLAWSLPFQPWQQHVFPVELPFFLIGILSHRFYLWANGRCLLSEKFGWAGFIAAVIFLSLGNKLRLFPVAGESLWNSLVVAIVLFALIPPAFYLTKHSTVDRFIGEFSYPVYLWHIAIGYYFVPAQQLWQGYFLLLLRFLLRCRSSY